MRIYHLCGAAMVCAVLLGACGRDEDRREETELERNPTEETTAFDSAAAGTSINTTTPLDTQEANRLNAGAAGSDSATTQPGQAGQ